MTVLGHGLFSLLAADFWSAFIFRALTGVGWAYMTGLKLLADKVDAKLMSRAAAGHAASIGVSGALSFAFADLSSSVGGWRMAFLASAASAALAWLLIALAFPGRTWPQTPAAFAPALFDFRPVLRNRSAMAYAIAYCVHTFEMSALRGWGVAFLGFVATSTGWSGSYLSPATTLTVVGLLGTLASVFGNEVAIYFGRRRLISIAMLASAVCAILLGCVGARSYPFAVIVMLIYGPAIWLDSASGTAEPSRRGATLAVHSTLGYLGGFVAPLLVGWGLDLQGGSSSSAWATVFALLAALVLLELALFTVMRPQRCASRVTEDTMAHIRIAKPDAADVAARNRSLISSIGDRQGPSLRAAQRYTRR